MKLVYISLIILWQFCLTPLISSFPAHPFQITEPIEGEIPLGTEALNVTYIIHLNETITFTATSTTKGYIGFGFTNTSGMFNSDIFIGGVSDDSTSYSGDYYSTNMVVPSEDAVQDWTLDFAGESEAGTSLIFSRALVTGDLTQDIDIQNANLKIVWALGVTDALEHHGAIHRGEVNFNLFDPTQPPVTNPPSTTTQNPGGPTLPPSTVTFPVEIPFNNPNYNATYSISREGIATFQITARTKGFIGFGFLNNVPLDQKTTEADMFMAGVYDNGTTYFVDYVALIDKSVDPPLFPSPQPDLQVNWGLIEGVEVGEYTRILFSRPLVTGDPNGHDLSIIEGDMIVLWSLGATDVIQYHGEENRGSIKYNVMEPFKAVENGGNRIIFSWFPLFMLLVKFL